MNKPSQKLFTQSNEKSPEVRAILREMPKWVHRRGMMAAACITMLILLAGLFISFPETYTCQVILPNQPSGNKKILFNTTNTPAAKLIKAGQEVQFVSADKNQNCKGLITEVIPNKDNVRIFVLVESTSSGWQSDQLIQPGITGSFRVTLYYKNLFSLLFSM
ncbi:MAG: hypothetical protein JNM68_16845 [Dinghuibacter sp.]|nr:hypothetical protein [Dinghuibacter sp.]